MLSLQNLAQQIQEKSDTLLFNEVIELIEEKFNYTPTAFSNGELRNPAGINAGSCKVLYLAQLQDLNETDALTCFGEHYRDVLADPEGDSHQNIRNFIKTGWQGMDFAGAALREKA